MSSGFAVINDWKQEEFGLIQRVGDRWHFCESLYIQLQKQKRVFCFSILDLQRSVICHEMSSRPEKYWAGGRDTSVTDPKTVTLLVTWVLQKQTTTKAKTLDVRLSLEKKCHAQEKFHAFCHALFLGIRSLQWLQRRSWGKQKKSTNRRVNHLQKILI